MRSRGTLRRRLCWNAMTGLMRSMKFSAMSSASGRASITGRRTSMTRRLLDRQVRLLEYLTSGDAIFRGNRQAPIDPALQGIDRGMLHLEARFSHEKRMEKIAAVFPVTFDLIGAGLDGIVRGFVDACPPLDISRIENARQFYDFLTARWKREPPAPCYLPDVAACELACAQVRVAPDAGEPATAPVDAARAGIRRKRGVVLLRAAYDIRAIFE